MGPLASAAAVAAGAVGVAVVPDRQAGSCELQVGPARQTCPHLHLAQLFDPSAAGTAAARRGPEGQWALLQHLLAAHHGAAAALGRPFDATDSAASLLPGGFDRAAVGRR